MSSEQESELALMNINYHEQVFITDLEAEDNNNNWLTFPRISEVEAAFPQCKEALVKTLTIH